MRERRSARAYLACIHSPRDRRRKQKGGKNEEKAARQKDAGKEGTDAARNCKTSENRMKNL
jgi:hypothetical protein